MALTPEIVSAKLVSLNETQESITGIAHWVIYHKRYANEIIQLWLESLREAPPNKKLLLLYLINEVVQQSRVKKITDLIDAVAPFVVEAVPQAYASCPSTIKTKIKYVYDVWCQRAIFSKKILTDLQNKFMEADYNRLGQPSAVDQPEWMSLSKLFVETSIHAKSSATTKSAVDVLYKSFHEKPSDDPQLNDKFKAQLINAVSSCEKTHRLCLESRLALISSLETLLNKQRQLVEEEEANVSELTNILAVVEGRNPPVNESPVDANTSEDPNYNSDDAYSPEVDSYSPPIDHAPYSADLNSVEPNFPPLPPSVASTHREQDNSYDNIPNEEQDHEEKAVSSDHFQTFQKEGSASSEDSIAAGLYPDN
ncbi:RNA polymerase II transcription termination factor [Schizosaccharomyces cryophilus OY26]|uniref:RNA polymerase II transcription termination factor n=1 Tax=Schizosaccharomyces cryophilus (strain OY26 / ATCC MYA-4695 / CBS 11777 / NBRC 106824 / NRRL Y48691) TaxID=653667 RepID=S9VTP7_SCHCR|nr:RNA polymerase II transcription termination factor [Schizosaccharomyces cryophilus OY26]EPY49425.1 RNA polymerase II transcription termination factor [Schizosaccharomyces cryophilus OY26]